VTEESEESALLRHVLDHPEDVAPRQVLADTRFQQIARTIQQLVDAQELPSLAIAVASDGRIVWEAAFGWADREKQIPATPHTPYSLASISKPFTATAVMKLVEGRYLTLDRQANDYLGNARIIGRDASKATVRRLLSHTAGLPPYFRPFFGSIAPPIEELIGRDALVSSPPGRRHVYSNLGYGILEHIIARVSGMTYEEYMRREIFEPLELASASVPAVPLPSAALRYDARSQPIPFYDLGHRGASSIFASAHDLVRFGMFHLKDQPDGSPRILMNRSIDEMQRIQTPRAGADGYGLGWRISEEPASFRHVGHTGGMPGVTTVLNLFPGQRVVVVVLANRRSEAVLDLADMLAAAVMPPYRSQLRQARGSVYLRVESGR
jgi:CubicO group peptidase (beta-lactamase class C family)